MKVRLYKGIPKHEINASRKTSEGKTYSLDHPKELVIDMRYKNNSPNANSQGWERSGSYYFKALRDQHPELISKKNSVLIDQGKSPIVDQKFSDAFPQYKDYKGETLVHHHIGQDGQAVALPQSVHKGYGEIHTVEHDLGITDKAQAFSKSCDMACKRDPSLYGKTSDRFIAEQKKDAITGCAGHKLEHDTIKNTQNSIRGATHNTSNDHSAHNTQGKTVNKSR